MWQKVRVGRTREIFTGVHISLIGGGEGHNWFPSLYSRVIPTAGPKKLKFPLNSSNC